jgi:CBS domain-containing protein
MKVSDCMCRTVRLCSPDETLRDVARKMKEAGLGAMPVGEQHRLVGMITDRDIVVRAVADGKGPDTLVRDAMTRDVYYAFDDEELDNAAATMCRLNIRRLPVLNHQRRMVGILSLGDVWSSEEAPRAAAALHALYDGAEGSGGVV